MSQPPFLGATALIVMFAAAPQAASQACRLDDAAFAELAQRLGDGGAEDVLERVQAELRSHPDCWGANRLKTEALVALDRPDEAAAPLIKLADGDRNDGRWILALIDLNRRTGDWRSAPDLIARIEGLPERVRAPHFRVLLDALQEANESELAEDVVARMLAAPGPREETCGLGPAPFLELERQIADDDAAAALGRARLELEIHPSCSYANRIQAAALVALGNPGLAVELLTDWASRDAKDASRIEALVDLSRKTGSWSAPDDLTSRIDGLPEPARTETLRYLLDELYEANETRRAESVLGVLLPGASEVQIGAIRRALEAATRGDISAMWNELPSLPAAESSSALRDETLIVLARRVASACASKPCSTLEGLTQPPEILPRVSKVEPRYPPRARQERAEGTVILMAAVLPSGEPIVLGSARSTDTRFLRAAAEAVAQWRYEPGRVAAEPVATCYTVRMDFRLR